jgi:precorrin-6B methylase 2
MIEHTSNPMSQGAAVSYATARKRGANQELNRLYPEDRSVHEWYRFVLSFPPHLVRDYLDRFRVTPGQRVLDPFCGTGTVPVECAKQRIGAVGIEANRLAHFASTVKTDWRPDPEGLKQHAKVVAHAANEVLEADDVQDMAFMRLVNPEERLLRTLSDEHMELLLANSISPLPLHKALVLLEQIRAYRDEHYYRHELLALAKSVVHASSNLHFGPEVGVGRSKDDAPVVAPWLAGVRAMADDLQVVRHLGQPDVTMHLGDARETVALLPPESIDAVFTSPPYPNEKDYTRTTRLESVLLGFIASRSELRAMKKVLMRSNTRGVYAGDDDDTWVAHHSEIQEIAARIEQRRLDLGKTSGFERMYARVTKLYFGGMARHLAELRQALRPGAYLGYVVGDQASYLQVYIPTGKLIADIARGLGYEVRGIDLFRTRLATATGVQLREEVVVLRWNG